MKLVHGNETFVAQRNSMLRAEFLNCLISVIINYIKQKFPNYVSVRESQDVCSFEIATTASVSAKYSQLH